MYESEPLFPDQEASWNTQLCCFSSTSEKMSKISILPHALEKGDKSKYLPSRALHTCTRRRG